MGVSVSRESAEFIRISATEDGREIGRCRIYLIRNDLHESPYALLEDVFVDENHRNKGIGGLLVREVVNLARFYGCYKIIATSRFERESVHKFYVKNGFRKYGYEFRLDLK